MWRHWLVAVSALWAVHAWALDGNFPGEAENLYEAAWVHIPQSKFKIDQAPSLGGVPASRVATNPAHEALLFLQAGSHATYTELVYPRNAVVNRFEVVLTGYMNSVDVSKGACFDVAFLVTDTNAKWRDNLGGTFTQFEHIPTCCGDLTGNAAVSQCELLECTHYKDNGLTAEWAGSFGDGCSDTAAYQLRVQGAEPTSWRCDCDHDQDVDLFDTTRIGWFRTGASALGVTWLCGTPPFSGVPWYPPSVSSGNASSRVAVVRAHKDKNGSFASCTDLPGALSADGIEGRTGNQCGGLPGILALKRNSTRCPNENTNYMGFEWAHIKYYLQK